MAELRLHRRNSGERGLGGLEGLEVNRRVFQVAGDSTKLTGTTDAAGSSTTTVEQAGGSVGGGGALVARAERERGRGGLAECANERGEVDEQGARLKRDEGVRTWPENARSWARPRQGDRGREVEDELTGGDGGTEREGAGT
jgi:hypothetical protein